MRFLLPKSRPDQNEQLHGVKFEDGVAEVPDEHGPKLKPLLCGYYGCTVEGEDAEAEVTPPPAADGVKARLAAMAYPELQALAKSVEIKATQKREDLESELAAAIAAGTLTLPAAS